MSVRPLREGAKELPKPQGHAIGFADDQRACDAIDDALTAHGIDESKIILLAGNTGVEQLMQMMKGSWGEAEQAFLNNGIAELHAGHFVICVEADDFDEAKQIAAIASRHGGRSFTHFGTFVDTSLPT